MPTTWSGYLDDVSATFDTGVNNLQQDVTKALEDLAKKPSDPALLAAYQSKLSEYNLYRNAPVEHGKKSLRILMPLLFRTSVNQ
ncbi:Type III secretion cytoplasmic protein (YscF) [Salmonella bongori]|nr:Type III secretion cytoplasmic protein (YscF) [Salmonella bongori]